MNRYSVLLLLFTLTLAHFGYEQFNMDSDNVHRRILYSYSDRVFIDSVGDIRAILGSQGKSIEVSAGGEAIAVLYGHPSGDPNNSMEAYVAYSTDGGATWSLYGPHGTPPCRRLYNDVDGASDFHNSSGHLFFTWQENTQGYNDGELNVMIEENVPSSPSFSVPFILPYAQPPTMYPWEPSIAVAQDNPSHVVVTAIDWVMSGAIWAYCWVCDSGGYGWSYPIPMAQVDAAGKVRQGANGYVLYCYIDRYYISPTESTFYPYFMESTDGGYTWGPETPIPGFPVGSGSQFWWHEFDCEVINDELWAIYNDIGTPGGGPYVTKGIGSPGNWTWETWDVGQLGTCTLAIADTIFYCHPSQYPSLSYDPASNTILASYKAHYYKESTGTIYYNGAHIGGVYTTDNGISWNISQPLSAANATQIPWDDWNATEVAHRLVNANGIVYSYAIWVDQVTLILYFEKGLVKSFLPMAANEDNAQSVRHAQLQITPSISKGRAHIEFTLSQLEQVEINLYDINGRLIRHIHKGRFLSGHHSLELQNYDIPSGVYVISFETENRLLTRKFVLMR